MTEKVWKCTRADGSDFKTGTVNYADALAKGIAVEIDAESAEQAASKRSSGETVCGHGLHVSPAARKTIQFANRSYRPYRWFEGTVDVADIVERDEQKFRVRKFTPQREIFLADIFGNDLAERVLATRKAINEWASIPWFKPTAIVPDEVIIPLVNQWRTALIPWMTKGRHLPIGIRIVRSDDAAAADADADADAAADAADAAAYAAADAAAYAAADAAADTDAAAAYAAYAAADADADADAADIWWRYRYLRWYIRPYYILRRSAYWKIAGMPGENHWEPLIEIYKLGCMPIGFVKGEFVVYCPDPKGQS